MTNHENQSFEREKLRRVIEGNLVAYAVRIAEMVVRYAQFRCRQLISEGITLGYDSKIDVVSTGMGYKVIIRIEYEIPGWLIDQLTTQWSQAMKLFTKKWRHARKDDRYKYGREFADNTFPMYKTRALVVEESSNSKKTKEGDTEDDVEVEFMEPGKGE